MTPATPASLEPPKVPHPVSPSPTPRWHSSILVRLLLSLAAVMIIVFLGGNFITLQLAQRSLLSKAQAQLAVQKTEYQQQIVAAQADFLKQLEPTLAMLITLAKGPLINRLSEIDVEAQRSEAEVVETFQNCFQRDHGNLLPVYECLRFQAINVGTAQLVYSLNRTFITTTIRFFVENPDIEGIFVEDWEGKVYAGFTKTEQGEVIEVSDLPQWSPSQLVIQRPIQEKDELVGRLHFVYTEQRIQTMQAEAEASWHKANQLVHQNIEERRKELWVNRLVEGLLFFVLLLVAISVVTLATIIRPLWKLKENADQFTQGHSSPNIDVSRQDEIGSLAQSFQDMVQKLNASFSQIEAQNQAIREQNIELQNLDRWKDEFLSNTSHELRTPLHGMIGLSEALLEESYGRITTKQAQQIQLIIQSGRRLMNLINDILDFSAIKNQQLTLVQHPLYLHNMVSMVLAVFQPMIGMRSLELINVVPDDLPQVWADENRLQQILYNLIGNAMKFTESGHITVQAEVVPTESSQMVEVKVSDSGMGIPLEEQQRIFQAFTQGEAVGQQQFGGTGLGLSITEALVRLHRGALTLSSEVGHGTTFSFTLPVHETTSSPDENQGAPRQVPTFRATSWLPPRLPTNTPVPSEEKTHEESTASHTLLIVDDDLLNRQILETQLRPQPYTVLSAADGHEALTILEAERIDLLILDVMMPGLSGYDVCQRIRETYDPTALPIILLTAKTQLEDVVKGLECGANDYLGKPFFREELLARVHIHLQVKENQRLQQEIEERRALEQDLLATQRQLSRSLNQAMESNESSLPFFIEGERGSMISEPPSQPLQDKAVLASHLQKHRKQIQTLETAFEQFRQFMDRRGLSVVEDLRAIEITLDQAANTLLDLPSSQDLRQTLVHVMSLSLQYWEETTQQSRLELALESGIWKAYLDKSVYTTRTLNKYLHLDTLPKRPRWREVLKTAEYVLQYDDKISPTRSKLEQTLEGLRNLLEVEPPS